VKTVTVMLWLNDDSTKEQLVKVEVEVLKTYGDWALVKHTKPYCSMVHVPSGMSLTSIYEEDIEAAKTFMESLPAHPVGLPMVMPESMKEYKAMHLKVENSPSITDLHKWFELWMEMVGKAQ
jgi:hypothetical protein